MIRDLSRLAARDFDLLVVGGGIYGLATAYDAAQRGLSVALVERADFGGATSFNHLKTIHGGLRYLQSADLGRMRESIRERRTFARIAPRFIAPLPFVLPTSASLTRNAWAMRAALAVDALVGSDRNVGLGAAHHLPAGRIVAGAEARELLQWAVGGAIGSGAMWYDYETVQGDRLTFAFALAAAGHGAVLANYTEARALRRDENGRVMLVGASDALTGTEFDIRARIVVNAAGPWGALVLSRAGVHGRWPLLKVMNLVTSRPAHRAAVVAAGRSGRALVLLPWQGRTIIGTSESADTRSEDDQAARRAEVLGFVSEVNETFPALNLDAAEVTLVHRGIVPASDTGGRLSLLGHSRIIDHAANGASELISLVGVKYTTARLVAERAVNLTMKKLGKPFIPSRTSTTTLPGALVTDTDPEDRVGHAIREEMAQTLTDVVVRRTGVGASGHPGDAVAGQFASAMGVTLNWSEERKKSELEALARFYRIED